MGEMVGNYPRASHPVNNNNNITDTITDTITDNG